MVLVEYGSVVWDPHTSKEKESRKSQWSVMTMVATAVSPPCSPDLAGLLLNSDVRISG